MTPISSKEYGTLLSKKGKKFLPRDLIKINRRMDSKIHTASQARIAPFCPGALIWDSLGRDLF